MTIGLLSLTRDRVALLSDTLAGRSDEGCRPYNFSSKAELQAHLYAVTLARGPRPLGTRLVELIAHTHLPNGIGDLLPALPDAMRATGHEGEALVAGWCRPSGGFRAWRAVSTSGWLVDELAPDWCHPLPGIGVLPADVLAGALDDGRLVRLGHALVDAVNEPLRAKGEADGAGGELILSTIDRGGFHVRKAGKCSNFDLVKAAIEARHDHSR